MVRLQGGRIFFASKSWVDPRRVESESGSSCCSRVLNGSCPRIESFGSQENDMSPPLKRFCISWVELALSFMLWAGRTLPVKVRDKGLVIRCELSDARVQMLPLKQGSLGMIAESFRWIVKDIKTFSQTRLIPVYRKQGTSS